jgi:hypothetical protein
MNDPMDIANIANPIYDGAFKYLLDDNKIARIFLSALIGSEVLELEFRPTEYRSPGEERSIAVFRMDFSAKIRTEDGGHKLVIIEIQKTKLSTDLMRFRRYLGSQYASEENTVLMREDEPGRVKRQPLEILSIYFLGHPLKHTEEPVVWVRRQLYGAGGDPGQRIEGVREEFIEALTHDCIVVQIPKLPGRRRTDLEKLLAIFDQKLQLPRNEHMLGIELAQMPSKYREVVRRLVKAAAEARVQHEMEIEDTFIRDMEEEARMWREKERRAVLAGEEERRLKEEERRLKEEERRLKEEALREKEAALAQVEELKRLMETGKTTKPDK